MGIVCVFVGGREACVCVAWMNTSERTPEGGRTFKRLAGALDGCGLTGRALCPETIVPLYDSTYICCCVSESRPAATPGENDWGSAESSDKAWSESCRGSVLRRDRAATWQKEAERDHFLTLSPNPSNLSLHPPGHPRHGLVISRCTDGECVRANVCISALLCAQQRVVLAGAVAPNALAATAEVSGAISELKRRDETG